MQEPGHEVLVANVREPRALVHTDRDHTDRSNDQVDVERPGELMRACPKMHVTRPRDRKAEAEEDTGVDPHRASAVFRCQSLSC